MCQVNAFVLRSGKEKPIAQNVTKVRLETGKVHMETLLGEGISVTARVLEIDLASHRILLEEHDEQKVTTETLERAVAFHGHLGPYLVLGLRMGTLAKRLLEFKGHFDVKVRSFAGTKPSVSCMNDGIQISSGATLGKGNIEIIPKDAPEPRAEFEAFGKTLTISVKQKILDSIKQAKDKASSETLAMSIAEMPDEELFEWS